MDYKYVDGYQFAIIRSQWDGDINYEFFKYLSNCGIKYYLSHNKEANYVKRNFYIYCEKKFLLTRMRHDF